MPSDVSVHVAVRREVCPTDVAAEGSLSGVHEKVTVQRAVTAQLFATEAALEHARAVREFDHAVVGADVTGEVLLVDERAAAHTAG